jgi:hypothetical protein
MGAIIPIAILMQRSPAVRRSLFAAALLMLSTLPLSAQEQSRPGFTPLFNGKDLSGWHGRAGSLGPLKLAAMNDEERAAQRSNDMQDLREHWTVADGVIVNDGKGVYLTTDKEYGDIELYVDYLMNPKGDSGIYLRGTPQVQIWDFTDPEKIARYKSNLGSGGLWNNSAGAAGKDPLVLADKPMGQWNRFRIIQVGARTTVYLNDKLVVDHATLENYWDRKSPLLRRGPIQLQTHGSEIRWSNIQVREIPAEEANAILARRNADGFQSIFNGKDFAGWSGAVDNYQVVDGALACKAGKGGVLYTAAEYGDFVARLEFKLPPGGNNGLAIRYPGSGDAAYAGMCELQVLDTEHEKYSKLDPRQAHGSAYGMVPAHRGYLRPAGEWNFQEVTVKGPTIKVELNGSVILDTDLSKVTEYLAGRPHPGKDLPSGHFGFAGHNDPVQFRNVQIKRL